MVGRRFGMRPMKLVCGLSPPHLNMDSILNPPDLGILIWLDFQFASANYPRDNAFVETVVEEVDTAVRRVSYHPSLATLCGSNEAIIDTYRAVGNGSAMEQVKAQLHPCTLY